MFGYAGYLIARGFFSRRFVELAVGIVVAVLFGGALAWDLVPKTGISWQDHLFGGLGGIAAAWLLSDAWRKTVGSAAGRPKKAITG